MGWKTAIQFMGLVRGEPTNKSKRANGKAILAEMGKERFSSSQTLDRTKTEDNVYYQDNESGFSVWDSMCEMASKHRTPVVRTDKKTGEQKVSYRKLPENAVIGVAVIINPPYDVCKDWTLGEYEKFYSDSQECLEEMFPNIFREENLVFGVKHRDEGIGDYDEHAHLVYVPVSEDGRYCGNEIDAKHISEFHKHYAKMMRDKGWTGMEDLNTTDWEKYDKKSDKYDEEYIIKQNMERGKYGKSVNDYIQHKTLENYKETERLLSEVQEVHSGMGIEDLQEEARSLKASINTDKAVKKSLETDINDLTDKKTELNNSITTLTASEKALKSRVTHLEDEIEEKVTKPAKNVLRASESVMDAKKVYDTDELTKFVKEKYPKVYDEYIKEKTGMDNEATLARRLAMARSMTSRTVGQSQDSHDYGFSR